jgi:hypothetical protein
MWLANRLFPSVRRLQARLSGIEATARAPFIFDGEVLAPILERCRNSYDSNQPFPHALIDGFLPSDIAQHLATTFPRPDDPMWLFRESLNQPGKRGSGNAHRLQMVDPFIRGVLLAMTSHPMIAFLEELTGIEHLIPDHLFGGGLHQTLPGGRLDVHYDFNYSPDLQLYRRINLLLYLNPCWRDEYGGHLELWNSQMTHCVKKIAPVLNRCVIFNSHIGSHHGHPEPLRCPNGTSRNSIALYYYTREPFEHDRSPHETGWQERP